jgi:hypothetical protein
VHEQNIVQKHMSEIYIDTIVFPILFLILIGASLLCYYRSKRNNMVLKERQILSTSAICILVSFFVIAISMSQYFLYNTAHRFTQTAKLCGFIRSSLNLYLIPFLILGLAYLQLIEMIETVFQGIQESNISSNNDTDDANSSTIINMSSDTSGKLLSKTHCSLAVLLFGSFTNMISIAPAMVVTFFSYSSPFNTRLMQAHIYMWNYWELTLLFNVVFIGFCSMILCLKAFIIKNKEYNFLAGLMNHIAFILLFQFYGWVRFIIIVTGYTINQVGNTDENGAMYMFHALLICTLLYLAATLISNSAIFSNGVHRLAKRWSSCLPRTAESEENNEQLLIPSTVA